MNYGKIPTWQECQEKHDLDEVLPEDRGLLDPVEKLIHDQEPAGEIGEQFREQLQAVVDFLSENEQADVRRHE